MPTPEQMAQLGEFLRKSSAEAERISGRRYRQAPRPADGGLTPLGRMVALQRANEAQAEAAQVAKSVPRRKAQVVREAPQAARPAPSRKPAQPIAKSRSVFDQLADAHKPSRRSR